MMDNYWDRLANSEIDTEWYWKSEMEQDNHKNKSDGNIVER